jgi:hypothetical protein
MAAIEISPTERSSTRASAVVVAYGGSNTAGAAVTLHEQDPFIEAPIEFVPGVEARPSRGQQSEPAGSGPFGF